jgi:TRAP-type C4-dicarboxylate transport system permease small subunit
MEQMMVVAHLLGRAGLWFGGALVLLAAVLIGFDVLLRKFLETSIGGADELAGYALALGSAWALGAALLDRYHIRIDSLYTHFPRGLRMALDLVGLGMFIGFFGLVGWRGWAVVEQSWISASRSHTALATPTVIPQFLWVLGLAMLVVQGCTVFVYGVLLIARGRAAEATKVISTRSVAEEVEDEIHFLKEREAEGVR